MRRAARYDGFFPVDVQHPDEVAEITHAMADLRDRDDPFDIVVGLPSGADTAPYARAGATWCLVEFAADTVSLHEVRAVIRDGP
jgi:hypothetical protein